ncbi:hypothetical protein EGT07_22980 [Herbaspirillum sp. HC18]|nr:hypothetical protein EGT07_22980 [Herbaspirillum sp. HC18]
MEPTTVTLIVGLAGIVSTFTLGTIGLYFTAKSRISKHRETLFQRQMELGEEIVHLQARMRIFSSLLATKGFERTEEARRDLGESYVQFSKTEERAAVIFPVHLWKEVRDVSNSIAEIMAEYDTTQDIKPTTMQSFIARSTKVALLVRELIGVDELTDQSLSLFSRKKSFDRLSNLEVDFFKKMHADVNKKADSSV